MGTRSIAISDEAYLKLKGLKARGESFSEVILRIGPNTSSGTTLIRRFSVVIWGYCIAVWLYVIAYQLTFPSSIYDVLAWWLPIRMDYLGEATFILSFIFALVIALYHVTER